MSEINEIVVISGKGGTGKTSILASLVPFWNDLVIADCDVDAPDLNILLEEEDLDSKDFVGLQRPTIDKDICIDCKKCAEHCRFNAISMDIELNVSKCEGCGVCEYVCPVDAITMGDYVVGQIHKSKTIYGPLVHARLIPGEETSGKLVAEVRGLAKEIAQEEKKETILIDGSPGIACNVISSITGVNKAVVVVEPTMSGLHDLEKVHRLIQQFSVTAYVVINKADLSEVGAENIRKYCKEHDLEILLEVPFHRGVVEAVSQKKIPSLYDQDFFNKIGFDQMVRRLKE